MVRIGSDSLGKNVGEEEKEQNIYGLLSLRFEPQHGEIRETSGHYIFYDTGGDKFIGSSYMLEIRGSYIFLGQELFDDALASR